MDSSLENDLGYLIPEWTLFWRVLDSHNWVTCRAVKRPRAGSVGEVLRWRYGPTGQVILTYNEIAERHNISRQRAREVLARALRIARHPGIRALVSAAGWQREDAPKPAQEV